ncbi:MAG TPA: amidohydrolase family protein [Acidimicrobiia bacterium]
MTGIIDLHTHHYTDTYLKAVEDAPTTTVYRREADGRFVCSWRGGVALTVPQPQPGIEQRLEMMDQAGIQTQVLSVPSPSTYFLPPEASETLSRTVNEDLAEISRHHADRFRALAALPMHDTTRALAVLDHAMDQLEMSGIMISTNVLGTPLDDRGFEPFWEAADDRGLLVYVHPTVPDAAHLDSYALAIAVGFLSDTTLALARLSYSGVFERYPRIRWVFSHLGGTLPFLLPRLDNYYRQFPECREKAPRPPTEYMSKLIFDTASSHRPAIRCAVDSLGLDRLAFGSDYPHVPGGVGPYLEALSETGATGADLDGLLSGRAHRLLAGEAV